MKKSSLITITTRYSSKQRRIRHRRKQRISGKNRFRAAVRQVVENRPWLEEDVEEPGDIGDDIQKNIRLIGQPKKRELLSLHEKSILRRNAKLRTDDEKEILHKVIGHLKCFRTYPEEVTKKLVGTTYFVFYGPNRVIAKQGREATFLGFILKGRLIAYETRQDPRLDKEVTEVRQYFEPGDTFGEIPLLYNVPRLYTIVTETATELLVLKKEDFGRVLQASLQKQWDEVQEALTHFPYFSGWTELARRECCLVSEIMNYTPQQVILGENVGKKTSAHFMLNGTCRMLQKLVLRKKGDKYELHPNQQIDNKDTAEVEFVYMQLSLFTKGGCFGLGENLQGRLLVATSSVRLLRIPMYLLRQQNVANIWLRIKQFLDSRIPTNEELLQRYVEEKEWVKYRRRFCDALLTKQIPNNTTIHDTPYYWRAKKMDLGEVDKEGRYAKARQMMKRRKQTTDLPRENNIKERKRITIKVSYDNNDVSNDTIDVSNDTIDVSNDTIKVSLNGNTERKSTLTVSDRSQRISSNITALSDHPADHEDASDTVTI